MTKTTVLTIEDYVFSEVRSTVRPEPSLAPHQYTSYSGGGGGNNNNSPGCLIFIVIVIVLIAAGVILHLKGVI